MGVAAAETSILTLAKAYLKQRYNKPGNVYLGVVSRLDAVASGVLVFARTSKAAARLSEQFAGRSVEKTYWAIVAGRIERPAARNWSIGSLKTRPTNGWRSSPPAAQPADQQAVLGILRLLRSVGQDSLIEVELITGRKHQIRLQGLAARQRPSGESEIWQFATVCSEGIALHARRLGHRSPDASAEHGQGGCGRAGGVVLEFERLDRRARPAEMELSRRRDKELQGWGKPEPCQSSAQHWARFYPPEPSRSIIAQYRKIRLYSLRTSQQIPMNCRCVNFSEIS